MYPELFRIPVLHVTIWSYGLMMVVGFLMAVTVIRRLSRRMTPDPQIVTNGALYSLVAGMIGARVFYVVHHFDQFRDHPALVFAIWQGGLELLGGVLLAIIVIVLFVRHHKMAMRPHLDILAIGLMLALVFGRIGCFLNGCCFGKPADLPWAVRFPYGSFAYRSQVQPDLQRHRAKPYLELPPTFFGYMDAEGAWIDDLKPLNLLTAEQRQQVTSGPYRCLAVHPTQLYSSLCAAIVCGILYLFWRRSQAADRPGAPPRLFTQPGSTFALMFILYGIMRFLIESVRDDNPFEIDSLTISQLLSIPLVLLGLILMIAFQLAHRRTAV